MFTTQVMEGAALFGAHRGLGIRGELLGQATERVHARHSGIGQIQDMPTETLELRTATEARFEPRRVFWFFDSRRITSCRLHSRRFACGQNRVAETHAYVGH